MSISAICLCILSATPLYWDLSLLDSTILLELSTLLELTTLLEPLVLLSSIIYKLGNSGLILWFKRFINNIKV